MTDDILTQLQNDVAFRLRLQAEVSNLYEIRHPHMVRVPTLYEEAADEIERLRKIIADFKGSEVCDPDDPCEMCKD